MWVIFSYAVPCALIGSPVKSICRATLRGTDLETATPGVEQNSPTFTLKIYTNTYSF